MHAVPHVILLTGSITKTNEINYHKIKNVQTSLSSQTVTAAAIMAAVAGSVLHFGRR